MAARIKTITYTFTNTDAVSLATIINSPNDNYLSSLTLRAHRSNSGDIQWYDRGGTAVGGFLDAGEAVSFDLVGKFVGSTELKLSATDTTTAVIFATVIG